MSKSCGNVTSSALQILHRVWIVGLPVPRSSWEIHCDDVPTFAASPP